VEISVITSLDQLTQDTTLCGCMVCDTLQLKEKYHGELASPFPPSHSILLGKGTTLYAGVYEGLGGNIGLCS
jgi:hypothetical protein